MKHKKKQILQVPNINHFYFFHFTVTVNDNGDNAIDDFDFFLRGEYQNEPREEDEKLEVEDSLKSELKVYLNEKKMGLKEKVLSFWEKNKTKYKRLYKIAAVYHQIPVTEVSVERLFSHVKFLLNPLRSTLSASLLDDILLLRLNFELYEKKKIPIVLNCE